MPENFVAEKLNENANFQAGSPGTRPAVVVAGVRVQSWVDDNGFIRVAIETDGGYADPSLWHHEDGTVALAVQVDNQVVFTR